ncbi:hypothetical protein [Paraliobacillus sp. X-1268]|uniref:hypothetical protein n=1 Tax=Paraliobacillus sp. X-1268 TaxID=2213193 RepID=UPI000E3C16E8|nr:hypothetical protein [Paraliobacillus sp. X-1268]
MNIKDTIISFIDKIMQPPISFLDMAIDRLQGIQMVTAQGLDLSKYLYVFGDMPTAWQLVITSLLISTVLLGSLLIYRSIMRIYYAAKEGVKWW